MAGACWSSGEWWLVDRTDVLSFKINGLILGLLSKLHLRIVKVEILKSGIKTQEVKSYLLPVI